MTGLLAEHPDVGSPWIAIKTGITELRGLAIQRLPHLVVYTNDADAVRILRVLHTSRDLPAEFADG